MVHAVANVAPHIIPERAHRVGPVEVNSLCPIPGSVFDSSCICLAMKAVKANSDCSCVATKAVKVNVMLEAA